MSVMRGQLFVGHSRIGKCSRMSQNVFAATSPTLYILRLPLYAELVIKSFRSPEAEQLHARHRVKRFRAFERVAQRKLRQLDIAAELRDLRSPPGNRLEALRGDRQGQYSIRINDQWRICFVWRDGDAYDVEIVDYH